MTYREQIIKVLKSVHNDWATCSYIVDVIAEWNKVDYMLSKYRYSNTISSIIRKMVIRGELEVKRNIGFRNGNGYRIFREMY
jgi:alpha-amylase/alpha-mannosidase (GH57 family)